MTTVLVTAAVVLVLIGLAAAGIRVRCFSAAFC
jgi:hypothetical protein